MVAQELVRFLYVPLMNSALPAGAQEALKLDNNEISAIKAARDRYRDSVIRALDESLTAGQLTDGVLTAQAMVDEPLRRQLLNSFKGDLLNGLDEESVSPVSLLDFEKSVGA